MNLKPETPKTNKTHALINISNPPLSRCRISHKGTFVPRTKGSDTGRLDDLK